jgi:hypothetical protein
MTSAAAALRATLGGIGRRQWLGAVAAGVGLALVYMLHDVAAVWTRLAPTLRPAFAATQGMRWCVLFVVVALLARTGASALQAVEQRRALRLRDHLAFVFFVAVGGAVFGELPALAATRWVREASGLDWTGWRTQPPAPLGVGEELMLMWSLSVPMLLVVPGFWTLARVWSARARDAGRMLAGAQTRLADVRRRVLAAQLRGTQAMVEPGFLFGTLEAIERRFESDPPRAAKLLDALIRYLRAAMPAHADAATTLAEQGELVRAWLDIEGLRSLDALHAQVDVPVAVGLRPFAPLLLVPLVAQVVQLGLGPARQGRVDVRAVAVAGRLVVSVDAGAPGPAAAGAAAELPALAEVRERLAALYGADARLVVEAAPGGARARIDIHDPEEPA